MIRTGIPMIDMFNTLVVSQKLPIFSISGEPYNQLLARIAMQAEVDVIVLGGMGLKYDDYLYFKKTLEDGYRSIDLMPREGAEGLTSQNCEELGDRICERI